MFNEQAVTKFILSCLTHVRHVLIAVFDEQSAVAVSSFIGHYQSSIETFEDVENRSRFSPITENPIKCRQSSH